jgi:tRNA-splicing ligase RtcB
VKHTVLANKDNIAAKMWTEGVPVEEEAKNQILNVAKMPFLYKWVAVMPDVHVGMGATIGSVIPTKGAVIPAAVGVDIGCGMLAVPVERPKLGPKGMYEAIANAVPHGRSNHGGWGDIGAWDPVPERVKKEWAHFEPTYQKFLEIYPDIETKYGVNTERHLGTLGTGNHFIEVSYESVSDRHWIVIHSGSRGVGNRLGAYFIKKAQQLCEQYFIDLPDKHLAYFPEGTFDFDNYLAAVEWAQSFAHWNRKIMLANVLEALAVHPTSEVIHCHHNFVARENHFGKNVLVTRKGAVRARKGDLGIIPGSMGAKTYIVRGKGNKDSFESCSHGAGRVMSRGEAKKKITIEQHKKDLEGVYATDSMSVIDESPRAYKDIDDVMEAQSDLVDVITSVKQIVCVKG